jgi:hypothetical protein
LSVSQRFRMPLSLFHAEQCYLASNVSRGTLVKDVII